MNNKPILFFDSGLGGLPYLQWLEQKVPGESLIYLADNLNFPYGEKTQEEIKSRLLGLMERLMRRWPPKLAVIACNTASVTALAALRENFDLPFVGTVPAIKPAALGLGAAQGREEKIGLLATNRTVNDVYTQKLIADFAPHCRVIRQGAADLVSFVENRMPSASRDERLAAVKPYSDFFLAEGAKAVVLACTHFIFLRREFEETLGPEIRLVDSVDGVGRQILRLLDETGPAGGESPPLREFYVTLETAGSDVYPGFAKTYGLAYRGVF